MSIENIAEIIGIDCKNLCEAEKFYGKDSVQFTKSLEKLKKDLEIEDKVYQSIEQNEVPALLVNLISKSDCHEASSLTKIANSDKTYRVKWHMFSKLVNLAKENNRKNLEKMKLGKVPEEVVNELSKNLRQTELQSELYNDVCRIFLSLLEEEISKSTSEDIRKTLFEAKYELFYLEPEIASEYVASDLKNSSDIFLKSTLQAFLLQVRKEDYDKVRLNFCMRMVELHSNALLCEKIQNPTLRLMIIKAVMMMASEELAEYLKENFQAFTETEGDDYNQEVVDLISESLEEGSTLKKNYSFISFGPYLQS